MEEVLSDNASLLHAAAAKGCTKTVEILLDKGTDVNDVDKSSSTPLHTAIQNGHKSVVQLLINRGADITITNALNLVTFFSAVTQGHVNVVELLIKSGASYEELYEGDVTPLHLAACRGFGDVVTCLLGAGADVNSKDTNNLTPLHVAVESGHLNVVKILLQAGADVNAVDGIAVFINRCLTFCCYGCQFQGKCKYITDKRSALKIALANNKPDIAKVLLHYGADASDAFNFPVVGVHHLLNKLKDIKCYARLVGYHRNFISSSDCFTVLHAAVLLNQVSLVEVLLEKGTDINAATYNLGYTALHLASYYNCESLVKLLLMNKAYFNIKNKAGLTPLDMNLHNYNIKTLLFNIKLIFSYARRGNVIESVKLLSSDDIDIMLNARNVDGDTALHCAAREGRIKIVKLLLQSGACHHATNSQGLTPKDVAADKCKLFLKNVDELYEDIKNKNLLDRYQKWFGDENDRVLKELLTLEDCDFGSVLKIIVKYDFI